MDAKLEEGECVADALGQIRREIAAGVVEFGEGVPFLFARKGPRIVRLTQEEVGDPQRWFFIGDIHGDFLALFSQLQKIKALCPDFRVVFLGDLVDRGPESAECFVYFWRWAQQHPGQVCWIVGNHDAGVLRGEGGAGFRSAVDPAEFVEWLKETSKKIPLPEAASVEVGSENPISGESVSAEGLGEGELALRRQMGERFVEVVAKLPVAVLFPCGLLATHGGFPHSDLLAKMPERAKQSPEEFYWWLALPENEKDFLWNRITRYRRKHPDRTSSGSEYGYGNFEEFCASSPEGMKVERMVNGHQHYEERWVVHKEYTKNPVVTVTGFGFPVLAFSMDPSKYVLRWIVGRHRSGELPEPIEVPVPDFSGKLEEVGEKSRCLENQ